ncbi:hypothetical protein CAEBREN_21978 [Caenorhabditis brenneri]|uniref:RING-type E3 ubiquitin transferase n=1 Tax=Caenorhabditis brenneri TaxID=135651 RepID=G0MJY4_CAEBE|nr:hypothetical protein CAEBREN_21978 [Caenorhabditis brenneri]
MPWCQRRLPPILYLLFFYGLYTLFIFPCVELICFFLRVFGGIDIRGPSHVSPYIYGLCLSTIIPCYLIVFYMSWRKNRAKACFVPKWKSDEPLAEEDVQCTICYDIIVDPHTLRCQHSFCKKCIDQFLPANRRCPACQQWVYWSSKNALFKSKVLEWVKENGKDEEYEEILKMKNEIKLPKTSCLAMFRPLLMPFDEIPLRVRRPRRRQRRRNRRQRAAAADQREAIVEPVASRQLEPLVVNVVDEVDNVLHVPLVLPKVLSIIIEVPEDVIQDPDSAQISSASSIASISSILSRDCAESISLQDLPSLNFSSSNLSSENLAPAETPTMS